MQENPHENHKNKCLALPWKKNEYGVEHEDEVLYGVHGDIDLWYCVDCDQNYVHDWVYEKYVNIRSYNGRMEIA